MISLQGWYAKALLLGIHFRSNGRTLKRGVRLFKNVETRELPSLRPSAAFITEPPVEVILMVETVYWYRHSQQLLAERRLVKTCRLKEL